MGVGIANILELMRIGTKAFVRGLIIRRSNLQSPGLSRMTVGNIFIYHVTILNQNTWNMRMHKIGLDLMIFGKYI